MTDNLVGNHTLADGVSAEVRDTTSHYFGGYYHVRLDVQAEIRLQSCWFEDRLTFEQACKCLGDSVCFKRTLEKMAVPEAEIEDVRLKLMDTFEKNMLVYLLRPDFPRRFAHGEYVKALGSTRPKRTYHHG